VHYVQRATSDAWRTHNTGEEDVQATARRCPGSKCTRGTTHSIIMMIRVTIVTIETVVIMMMMTTVVIVAITIGYNIQ
jgi:hypothetical protein